MLLILCGKFLVADIHADEGANVVIGAQNVNRAIQQLPVMVDIVRHFTQHQLLQGPATSSPLGRAVQNLIVGGDRCGLRPLLLGCESFVEPGDADRRPRILVRLPGIPFVKPFFVGSIGVKVHQTKIGTCVPFSHESQGLGQLMAVGLVNAAGIEPHISLPDGVVALLFEDILRAANGVIEFYRRLLALQSAERVLEGVGDLAILFEELDVRYLRVVFRRGQVQLLLGFSHGLFDLFHFSPGHILHFTLLLLCFCPYHQSWGVQFGLQ